MNNLSSLFTTVHSGAMPTIFNDLDLKIEQEEKLQVEATVALIEKIITPSDVIKITAVLDKLIILEKYIKWLEHPVYLNEFKDKNGNRYLQGRTSIKGVDGKTKWINAYVGSLNDYPKGVNDTDALRKARPLIRKKLKKFYGL